MALAGRRLGAPRSRCSFIGEACCPQPPCALRVAAAWAHLGARRSSAMKEHRLRRVSADLGPWRSQRVPLRVLPRALGHESCCFPLVMSFGSQRPSNFLPLATLAKEAYDAPKEPSCRAISSIISLR